MRLRGGEGARARQGGREEGRKSTQVCSSVGQSGRWQVCVCLVGERARRHATPRHATRRCERATCPGAKKAQGTCARYRITAHGVPDMRLPQRHRLPAVTGRGKFARRGEKETGQTYLSTGMMQGHLCMVHAHLGRGASLASVRPPSFNLSAASRPIGFLLEDGWPHAEAPVELLHRQMPRRRPAPHAV